MPRMRRGRERRGYASENTEEQRRINEAAAAGRLDTQCTWCGKARGGVRAGLHDVILRDEPENGYYTSHGYCDDDTCMSEEIESGYNEQVRDSLRAAGVSEEQLPPRMLSRLEQRTGIDPHGNY